MSFFGEVVKEMKAVEWPSGKELMNDSGTVFSTIILFSIFFYAVDWIIQKVLGWIVR